MYQTKACRMVEPIFVAQPRQRNNELIIVNAISIHTSKSFNSLSITLLPRRTQPHRLWLLSAVHELKYKLIYMICLALTQWWCFAYRPTLVVHKTQTQIMWGGCSWFNTPLSCTNFKFRSQDLSMNLQMFLFITYIFKLLVQLPPAPLKLLLHNTKRHLQDHLCFRRKHEQDRVFSLERAQGVIAFKILE
jgi:hypothetical protein